MNFEKFNALVENRANYGELESASVVSEYKNIGCGDGYRLFLEIADGKISNARYTTTGCSFSLASLTIICDLIRGKTLEEAKKIQPEELETAIDGYPDRRRVYTQTAIQALQKAITDYENGTGLSDDKLVTRENTLKILETEGHLRYQKLASVMLDNLDLRNVNFSGSDLQNAFLRGSNLTGANFSDANLRGAFLNDCTLIRTNFTDADLRSAKLLGAKIDQSNFENAVYDIGTRVDVKNTKIFEKMQQKGKDIFVEKNFVPNL